MQIMNIIIYKDYLLLLANAFALDFKGSYHLHWAEIVEHDNIIIIIM